MPPFDEKFDKLVKQTISSYFHTSIFGDFWSVVAIFSPLRPWRIVSSDAELWTRCVSRKRKRKTETVHRYCKKKKKELKKMKKKRKNTIRSFPSLRFHSLRFPPCLFVSKATAVPANGEPRDGGRSGSLYASPTPAVRRKKKIQKIPLVEKIRRIWRIPKKKKFNEKVPDSFAFRLLLRLVLLR